MTLAGYILILTSILVFIAFDWGVKKAVYIKDYDSRIITQGRIFFVAWYLIVSYIGTKGVIKNFDSFPPAAFYFMIVVILLSVILAFTKIGEALTQLEWPYLIGFHAFRILAELALYAAYKENLAPIQMTFYGLNFDILSGITALLILPMIANRSRIGLIKLWNFASLGLLFTVLGIAMLSFPTPMRFFMNEPDNSWVAVVPYIYLPGILVFFGLFGHWVIFRKIRSYYNY